MHTFHIYESRSTYFCYSYIVARISLRSYYTLSIFAHFLQFSQRILSRFYCILSIFMNQFLYLLLYCCKNIILLHTFYTSTFDIAHLWITINYFCTLFTLAVKNIIKILLHTFHIYQRSTYFCTYFYILLQRISLRFYCTLAVFAKNIIEILSYTFYIYESRLIYNCTLSIL